ncbi:MAG: hypothetical protein NC314_11240 [Roseburia sp.]|nr:hypothetical protein [Roseburia sp.]MCM1243406.1 hypothetical protein [Roseburia sp.]
MRKEEKKKSLPGVAAVIIVVAAIITAGFFYIQYYTGVQYDMSMASVSAGDILLSGNHGKWEETISAIAADAAKMKEGSVDSLLMAERTDENAWAFDYLDLLDELEQEEFSPDGDRRYQLIYLEGDIPALAADLNGYFVSLFIWHDGEITTLLDKESYGMWGRNWEYQPYQNKICTSAYYSSGEDLSWEWSYYQVSEDYQLEFLYKLSYEEKADGSWKNYYRDDVRNEGEPVEITDEEFDDYYMECEGSITGGYEIEEVRKSLEKVVNNTIKSL